MQFVGVANPFGANAFEPVVNPQPRTFYYKGMRLSKMPVRVPAAPKPLSQTVKNFLLTYNR